MKRYYIVETTHEKELNSNLFYMQQMLPTYCSYKVSTIGKQPHKKRVVLESDCTASLDVMAHAIEIIASKSKCERVE